MYLEDLGKKTLIYMTGYGIDMGDNKTVTVITETRNLLFETKNLNIGVGWGIGLRKLKNSIFQD